jgi:pyruvate formate lyase activating enzyme
VSPGALRDPPRDDSVGLVFDVQRFSIHDGPGIRTVVFLKGCSLACRWCQNPEGISPRVELGVWPERCVSGCRACVPTCPSGALVVNGSVKLDVSRCDACGSCLSACPAGALRSVGRPVSAAALLAELEKDAAFYRASGGGVTLSGGEPVLQAAFLRKLLPLVRERGWHVALETAGHYRWSKLEPLLPHLDLVLYDLKLADPGRHREWTGQGNHRVIDNLRRLLETTVEVVVRMPVVPDVNTSAADVGGMAALLDDLGVPELVLLEYNPLWEAKLPHLSEPRRPLGLERPDDALYVELVDTFAQRGVRALR